MMCTGFPALKTELSNKRIVKVSKLSEVSQEKRLILICTRDAVSGPSRFFSFRGKALSG